ncbi:MAG: PaaI family thioesterase [Caulobacter sp.]|nr:PaaI family thioesterase [Caulobacter sp.]
MTFDNAALPCAKLMGVAFVEAGKDRVVGKLLVRDDLCTAGGILHGGAVMAFADSLGAVGAFLNLAPGQHTTTIESKTNFLGAAKVGATVTGTSLPVHIGGRTSVWQTRIEGENGKLVGLVTQTQMVLG